VFAGPAWVTVNTDWRGVSREQVVFTWPDGSMINPDRISDWFHAHRKAAGLPRIRPHDLRHTYATAALANARGWHEVKVISERLGHASIGITIDTYAHVLPKADQETAETLARLILGNPVSNP
jgi:integrase